MKITHIIFDMDGVIVDARNWHYLAFREAINTFDIDVTPSVHENEYDGLSTRQKLNKLSELHGLKYELHSDIQDLKQSKTIEFMRSQCLPCEVKSQMFSKLASQYSLAVASNSIKNTIKEVLSLLDIEQFFERVLSNEDVENPKPNAEIYTKTMTLQGANPESTLIIEDSPIGMKAALASGAHVLQVADSTEVTLERIINKIAEIESD